MGCSSTVSGVAAKAPEQSDSDGVNVALMDTGRYPTRAGHPFGTAGDPQMGAYLEAVRMAEFVVGPWEVDATLKNMAVFNTGPVSNVRGLKNDIGEEPLNIAAAHGFIAGFSTSRSSPEPGPQKALVNLVMRFSDTDSAAAAAQEMAEKASQPSDAPKQPVPIPRHPEAMASGCDLVNRGKTVQSYSAHGSYVLYQWANATAGVDPGTQLVAGILDLQTARIDGFALTDPAKLADLPIDPTGQMLARAMPPPQGQDALPYAGVYPPGGALHFEQDPRESASLFTSTGVEMVAYRWGPTVYEAHDDQGAARVADRFIADTGDAKPTGAVRGLPVAKCFAARDSIDNKAIFECLARADRYAFSAIALQETDAKQMVSAQYRILAGK